MHLLHIFEHGVEIRKIKLVFKHLRMASFYCGSSSGCLIKMTRLHWNDLQISYHDPLFASTGFVTDALLTPTTANIVSLK